MDKEREIALEEVKNFIKKIKMLNHFQRDCLLRFIRDGSKTRFGAVY